MHTHYSSIHKSQVTLLKSRSETITMSMICSLIEHGFPPVFSIERKLMLNSDMFLRSKEKRSEGDQSIIADIPIRS